MTKNSPFLCIIIFLFSLIASGQIYSEDFTGQNGKGAVGPAPTIDLTGVSWTIDVSGATLSANTDWFRVLNEVFEVCDIDGPAIWTSPSIDISGYTNVNFSLNIVELGDHEADDYVDVEYSTDGGTVFTKVLDWNSLGSGTRTLIGDLPDDGDWQNETVSITGLSGTTFILRITVSNNADDEYIRFDDIVVDGTPASTDQPDWCNIQFPTTAGVIQLGETYPVYAQVYEAGITEAAGQGAGISAWIGYNAINNNPDGGAGWTWVPASYNPASSGNNDEYFVDLGASIPATGIYYYASRFQLNSGPFVYGGSGGIWNNDSVELTVNPHVLDWCNVQYPATGSITTGDTFDVFAQVYEPGVTDTPASQGANIEAWIGYSITDSDPSGAGWTWVSATYNPLCGTTCGTPENNDEYYADIGSSLSAGTYYYASRFRIDNDTFYYGGYSASNGGFWSAGVNVNGVLTVTDPAGSTCLEDGFDTIDGWVTHSAGNWTQNTPNGTYTGNGVYINANDAIAEYKLGFNDVNDWFELPPLDNPLLFTYWGRLSTNPGGTNAMKVQVFDGGVWNDVVEHVSTSTSYVQYSANLSAYSGNTGVRVRLLRSQDDRSMYVDDIEVICVDCTPTHSITGFTPSDGPEGTFVTIDGTGFTAGTTVSFNGASATIDSQTATQLVVIVPSGASTGLITVTEAMCDVTTSSDFTLINSVDSGCEGGVSATDLFISEVTDATYGSMTYVEIYNGTGAAVNLADYDLEITYNGNSNNTDIVTLTGSLANGAVHVVRTSTAGFVCSVPGGDGSYADQIANGLNGIDSAKNDSDCITLYKNSIAIDVWGDCSDKNWRENLGVAIGNEGFDFRRLATSSFPNTSFSLADWSVIDWTDGSSSSTCSENDYSDIGNYASGIPPSISVEPNTITGCQLTATLSVTAAEGYGGGDPLVFQWYTHTPGDGNWILITDGTDYSGTSSSVLTINNVLNHIDYQFYCQVRENDNSCYQASVATRLDIARTTWNGTAWDNGIPDINTIAVIDANYNTGAGGVQVSFSACNLLINTGNRLTIDNLSFIEVEHDVIVNGQFYIETQGALVQNDDAGSFVSNVSDNDIVLTKTTHDLNNWYDYTYWSSPVNAAQVNDALGFANPSFRFLFNASNYLDLNADDIDDNGDDWVLLDGSDTMTPGVGYAATHSPIGFLPGVGYDYVFRGPFNTGTITSPVVYNASNANHWNLLGNPFPSAISIDDFFTENNSQIDAVVYMWSHYRPPLATNPGNEVLNFNQSDYVVINNTGETGNGSDLDGDGDVDALDIPSRFIPSGQSFFVSSTTNGNVTFSNGMRMANGSSNSQFFAPNPEGLGVTYSQTDQSQAESNKMWINMMSDNGAFNQLMVGYVPNATNGFDGISYDARRQLSTGNAAIIYTMIEEAPDQKFQIEGRDPASLNTDEVIPLGFDSTIDMATVFTLSNIKNEGPFFEENTVYLRDNYLNIIHDLSTSDYHFTSETGEFRDRFEILFENEALDVDDMTISVSDAVIYEDLFEHINIKLPEAFNITRVEVLDLLGRQVLKFNSINSSEFRFDATRLSQATYLIRLSINQGSDILKKLIKR